VLFIRKTGCNDGVIIKCLYVIIVITNILQIFYKEGLQNLTCCQLIKKEGLKIPPYIGITNESS
jgi:hypothetical protein